MDSSSWWHRSLGDLGIRGVCRKLGRLSLNEWLLLCQVSGMLWLIEGALRTWRFPALASLLHQRAARVRQRSGDIPLPIDRIDRFARLVTIADARGPLPPSCLRKSLALAWWLSDRGVAAHVQIGVAKDGERLHAHAWLETATSPIFRAFHDDTFVALTPQPVSS